MGRHHRTSDHPPRAALLRAGAPAVRTRHRSNRRAHPTRVPRPRPADEVMTDSAEDAVKAHQRPKLETYGEVPSVVLKREITEFRLAVVPLAWALQCITEGEVRGVELAVRRLFRDVHDHSL